MTITLKLYCPGIKIDMTGESMELPEGAIVEEAIRESLNSPGVTEEVFDGSFMINRNPANLKSVLADGDELIAIKVINGG